MRYTIIVLALLGVLASPRPAAAAAMSGNDLLKVCKVADIGTANEMHSCLMYV